MPESTQPTTYYDQDGRHQIHWPDNEPVEAVFPGAFENWEG